MDPLPAFTGTVVTMTTTGVVVLPRMTFEDYWRLPERESATCPICERPGAAVDNVWLCSVPGSHAAMWRWPGVIGMD